MTTARKVRQILGSIFFGGLIGAGLTAIAICRGGLAHADADNDKAFLYEVSQLPYVTIIDGPDVIRKAREGCMAAMYEQNPSRVAEVMWPFAKALTAKQIGAVAYIAAEHYCPVVLTYDSVRGGAVI